MLQRVYSSAFFAAIACIAILALGRDSNAFGQDSKSESAPTNATAANATATNALASQVASSNPEESLSTADSASVSTDGSSVTKKPSNRVAVLIGSLTVFALAVFVGFEVINKVPPTLHTPLMSGSNAISGITVVGAILSAGFGKFGLGSLLGATAIILAMINVAGGFWVTHRMLSMFKKK